MLILICLVNIVLLVLLFNEFNQESFTVVHQFHNQHNKQISVIKGKSKSNYYALIASTKQLKKHQQITLPKKTIASLRWMGKADCQNKITLLCRTDTPAPAPAPAPAPELNYETFTTVQRFENKINKTCYVIKSANNHYALIYLDPLPELNSEIVLEKNYAQQLNWGTIAECQRQITLLCRDDLQEVKEKSNTKKEKPQIESRLDAENKNQTPVLTLGTEEKSREEAPAKQQKKEKTHKPAVKKQRAEQEAQKLAKEKQKTEEDAHNQAQEKQKTNEVDKTAAPLEELNFDKNQKQHTSSLEIEEKRQRPILTLNTAEKARKQEQEKRRENEALLKNEEHLPQSTNSLNITYLYHMTHIKNISSILSLGLKSHNTARGENLMQRNIADNEVNDRRDKKEPQFNRNLHDCVPLYFNPKNPMLYRLKGMQNEIAIIAINKEIMLTPEMVFTNGNAASIFTGFYSNVDNLNLVDWTIVFGHSWSDCLDGKRIRNAEVLIPYEIPTSAIKKIYCNSPKSEIKIKEMIHPRFHQLVKVNKYLYF